jgi:hypothetical protein
MLQNARHKVAQNFSSDVGRRLVWGKLRLVLVWAWVQTSTILTQLPAIFSIPPEKYPGNSLNDVTGGWSCNCNTIVRASLQAMSDVKCGHSLCV